MLPSDLTSDSGPLNAAVDPLLRSKCGCPAPMAQASEPSVIKGGRLGSCFALPVNPNLPSVVQMDPFFNTARLNVSPGTTICGTNIGKHLTNVIIHEGRHTYQLFLTSSTRLLKQSPRALNRQQPRPNSTASGRKCRPAFPTSTSHSTNTWGMYASKPTHSRIASNDLKNQCSVPVSSLSNSRPQNLLCTTATRGRSQLQKSFTSAPKTTTAPANPRLHNPQRRHPISVTCREGGVGEYPVSRDSLHGNEGGACGEGIVLRTRGSLRPIALRTPSRNRAWITCSRVQDFPSLASCLACAIQSSTLAPPASFPRILRTSSGVARASWPYDLMPAL